MPATYESIATTTISSPTSSITFSGIASSWTDLRISFSALAGTGSQLTMRLNSDTSSNYSYQDFIGTGSSVSGNRSTNATSFVMHYNGFDATLPTFVPIDIFSYAGSTYKTVLYGWNADRNGSGYVKYSVGLWRSTSAITSVTLTSDGTMAAGTIATLYGIKNA